MNICTYFDKNYINKAKVCINTIKKYKDINLFVLCFDKESEKIVQNENVINLTDIENYYPDLLKVKNNRSQKAYYATITPILPLYIFDKYEINKLFYTDADMAFYSDPKEIEEVMGNYSLMVSPHENPAVGVAGYFNVGILGYRNDENCREFLNWWTGKVIEWCEWIAIPEKKLCAEQRYLDIIIDEPNRFKNTLICPHPGVNLASWRVVLHNIQSIDGKLYVDSKNLICYHYHGYGENSQGPFNNTGWIVSKENIELIYKPYYNLLRGNK